MCERPRSSPTATWTTRTLIDFYDADFAERIAASCRSIEAYLVYCRSGNRSGQAVALMEELGFDHVYDLDGGIVDYAAGGSPAALRDADTVCYVRGMSFRPLNVPPSEHDGDHRYVHVIGASVFVDDRPAETTWSRPLRRRRRRSGVVGGRRSRRRRSELRRGRSTCDRSTGVRPSTSGSLRGVPSRSSSGRGRIASAVDVARRPNCPPANGR